MERVGDTMLSHEVGLYVDQRDDVLMKPRRPYFSSADKVGGDWADVLSVT